MSDIQVEPLGDPGRPSSRLRALWRQPPYSVVAIAAALIGAAATTVYMDRPIEVVDAGPSVLRLNPAPESWLNISSEDRPAPVQSGEELATMLARHPADAVLTQPLESLQENLVALPPGTYRVQASCSAETVAVPDGEGPAGFTIEILDPVTYQPVPQSSTGRAELVCDGEPHSFATGLTVTGHQAFTVYFFTALDERAAQGSAVPGVPGVFVAVSFTRAS